jgi:hypothetical protein
VDIMRSDEPGYGSGKGNRSPYRAYFVG